MASQANSTTAPIVPVNATMAELFEQWQAARAAAHDIEDKTQAAHDLALAETIKIAPRPIWSMRDFRAFGGEQDWVGQSVNTIHVEWVKRWFGLHAAQKAPLGTIRYARTLIAKAECHWATWEQLAETHGYNAGTEAEAEAYKLVAVVEDAVIRRPSTNLEELKLKAQVVLPSFHAEGSPGHEWADACALSLIEDLAAL